MKLASVELISEINPHPNADKLDLAKVLGYTCIVEKDKYKAGDAVVLIQPDTVLPNEPWAEFFKKRGSRVKAMKLRGVWSFGIVMPFEDVVDPFFFADQYGDVKDHIGVDVAHLMGVTKYEAPAPQALDAKGPLPFGLNKTDEERYQNFLDLPFGERVDVTLKVDGQSATYYCKRIPFDNLSDDESEWPVPFYFDKDGVWVTGVCSRSLEMKPECVNNYTRIDKKYNILEKLLRYCMANNVSLALRGEIYGNGIQGHANNPHSKLPLDFVAFSVFNFDTNEYENVGSKHYYAVVSGSDYLGVPRVPTISRQVLTPELIKHYAEDISEIDGKPFEGVVIKHKSGSFKVINLAYDERK